MWVVVALGLAAFVARALDWFRRPPAEQLLVLWVGVGVFELLLHDVGNERRFVFLIPAFTALAALAIAADRAIVPAWLPPLRGWRRVLFVPVALLCRLRRRRDRWSAWRSSTTCARRSAAGPRWRSWRWRWPGPSAGG